MFRVLERSWTISLPDSVPTPDPDERFGLLRLGRIGTPDLGMAVVFSGVELGIKCVVA